MVLSLNYLAHHCSEFEASIPQISVVLSAERYGTSPLR